MSFELQPTLRGDRVHLRPLRPEDFEPLYAVSSDPEVWAQHPESDRYKRPVFEEFFATAMKSGGALAILDSETSEIIGSSRYTGYDPAASKIEIGYTFLARKYWGGPTNRELKNLMLDHAFRFVRVAHFYVGENNLRSRRAMEKIGGKLVNRVERTQPNGRVIASVLFEIARDPHA